MNENNIKLTVVITTYNRKEPLLEQLKSLEVQGHYDKYEIIVSDNHSDYDVKEWLELSLKPEFMKIIKVIVRPFNVGGDMNITLSFQYANTEWMWLLSDDDITTPNSIKTILDDIERHRNDDVCCVKYSISGKFVPNDDKIVDNIEDFFNYYTKVHSAGEMVYMCNNVFRMNYLRKFITDVTMDSNTSMSQVLLPLLAVKNDNKKICFSPESLTSYISGRISYNLAYVYLRFGNMIYVKSLCLNGKEIRAFKRLTFFGENELIKVLCEIPDKSLRCEMLKKILIAHFGLLSISALKLKLYLLFYPFFKKLRNKS